jgi:hypothetical protein
MTSAIREIEEKVMAIAGNNPKLAKCVRDVRASLQKLAAEAAADAGGGPEPSGPRTAY